MSQRVLYSGFVEKQQYTLDFLCEKFQWDPIFVISHEAMSKPIRDTYKEAIFYPRMQLRSGLFDYSVIGDPVPIDAKLIEDLSPYELFAMGDLLEDSTGWNFGFYERRRFYYDILQFLNTVIHRLKIDIYVSANIPQYHY